VSLVVRNLGVVIASYVFYVFLVCVSLGARGGTCMNFDIDSTFVVLSYLYHVWLCGEEKNDF